MPAATDHATSDSSKPTSNAAARPASRAAAAAAAPAATAAALATAPATEPTAPTAKLPTALASPIEASASAPPVPTLAASAAGAASLAAAGTAGAALSTAFAATLATTPSARPASSAAAALATLAASSLAAPAAASAARAAATHAAATLASTTLASATGAATALTATSLAATSGALAASAPAAGPAPRVSLSAGAPAAVAAATLAASLLRRGLRGRRVLAAFGRGQDLRRHLRLPLRHRLPPDPRRQLACRGRRSADREIQSGQALLELSPSPPARPDRPRRRSRRPPPASHPSPRPSTPSTPRPLRPRRRPSHPLPPNGPPPIRPPTTVLELWLRENQVATSGSSDAVEEAAAELLQNTGGRRLADEAQGGEAQGGEAHGSGWWEGSWSSSLTFKARRLAGRLMQDGAAGQAIGTWLSMAVVGKDARHFMPGYDDASTNMAHMIEDPSAMPDDGRLVFADKLGAVCGVPPPPPPSCPRAGATPRKRTRGRNGAASAEGLWDAAGAGDVPLPTGRLGMGLLQGRAARRDRWLLPGAVRLQGAARDRLAEALEQGFMGAIVLFVVFFALGLLWDNMINDSLQRANQMQSRMANMLQMQQQQMAQMRVLEQQGEDFSGGMPMTPGMPIMSGAGGAAWAWAR